VVRAIVLYDQDPDGSLYDEHVELCRKVPGSTFRHGKIFGAPLGEPAYQYYAEFEWPDREAFKAAAPTAEFMATGKHAMELGTKFTVMFADVD
jgi:hypothetical protein